MKNIAIVILNWNGKDLLEKFLPSVTTYSQQAKIYIADNNSTDDSVNFVTNNYPEITIIKNDINYGYAEGYNKALTHVNEPILCLLNSDIEVTKNWLEPIETIFNQNDSIAIVQPQILAYNSKNYYEYAGAAGGFIDKYGFAYCRGRIFDTLEIKDQYQSGQIFWASGACLFIKNETFKDLNGFDQHFFAHQEEIDLCWRAFNRNKKAYYCAESTVYHVGGATLNQANPTKTYLNFRNNLCTLAKNLPKNKLFSVIFLRLCLDGIAGIRLFLQGKFSHTWAIMKSHFAFYKLLPNMLSKRRFPQREDYFQTKSIVYKYFIRKIKKFSNI